MTGSSPVRRRLLWLTPVLTALAIPTIPLEAQAQKCNRSCAAGVPRDARGCCVKKKRRKGRRPRKKARAGKPGKGGVRWIAIPAGRFMMGAARGKANQRPAHRVKIGKFWITRAEITAGQYSRCFSAGFCKPAGNGNCNYSNNNNNKKARQDHPTNCLGLRNARRFCAWIGGRLPSEAEWEYAARGGGKNRKYPWGKVEPTCDSTRVKMKSCGASGTAPVCSTPAGNTPHGLCDMAGNVAELVADAFHQDYNKAPADGSAWDPFKNTPSWTARGGSWASSAGSYSGVYRMVSLVGSEATTGFRCARSSRP